PRAVEAAGPNGATQRIDLLPAAVSRHRGRIVALSAGLAGGLALAALTLPFVSQALERGRVEQAIASLQPQADQATELRRRIAAGAAGADIIAAERAAVGDALQILAKVTDLMPDDTVLSELSLRQGRLAISGQSQSAARLIPALAADPLIRNPAFVAPVTRAPTSPGGNGVSTDLFSIHAELGS
ncbi:MAG: PilN domain-containing protein, partial [Acetobacteraceae bacterium]|nr:PilN domain-containing protein [Acetobacteraceae bacterium]